VSLLLAILILVLLGLVVLVVTAPLRGRRPHAGEFADEGPSHEPIAPSPDQAVTREDLEAAREAKYREIRDSELDFRTGKLSADDFAAIDAQLRAEAIAILNRLEALDSATPKDA
jgi:hypothetical protein